MQCFSNLVLNTGLRIIVNQPWRLTDTTRRFGVAAPNEDAVVRASDLQGRRDILALLSLVEAR